MRKNCSGSCGLPAINEAGYPVILIAVVVSLVLSLLVHSFSFMLLLVAVNFFICYFFRDPPRVVPQGDHLVVSPADGLISFVRRGVAPPSELGMADDPMVQVSIYLNVLNVHVTRMPVSGVVKNQVYSPGRFRNMYFARADGAVNYERNALSLEDVCGNCFALVQIAGFIARRIVCRVSVGDNVVAGHRCGIIRFGSRVDLYIPDRPDIVVMVRAGQTVVGGETVIASSLPGQEEPGVEVI